jgi:1-acyl-sn-glycerol-3-phosphate acyltransferase
MARGYLTLAVIGGFVLAAELATRTVLMPAILVFRRSRRWLVTAWMRGLAGFLLAVLRRLGGVRIAGEPRIPGREGVLVVANHQSILDIPLVVRALPDSHPRIVTRRRYARGIPLVSTMLAVTDSPLVDPQLPGASQVEALERMARTCRHPLVIFPEGHRSRDGALRPFRRGGLGAILRARTWTVHLLVVDGFWRAGKFSELARALSGLRGRVAAVGPIAWPGPDGDVDAFVSELEQRMAEELSRLREGIA